MLVKKFHYLSKSETNLVLSKLNNIKHRCIYLLMLDCGLRVSEAITLRLHNFDFKNRTITLQSIKKRGKESLRTIPLSNRLYREIAKYIEKSKLKLEPESFLFPSHSKCGHITRSRVWKILNKIKVSEGITELHPHTLRHSFATHHLENGTSLAEIKEMLGHKSYNTTLIYSEIPTETLKQRVNALTEPPTPLYLKVWRKIAPPKKAKVINIDFTKNYFTVGRNQELLQLASLVHKGVNVLVTGNTGVGKSHLLQNFKIEKKVLRIDDTESVKKTLGNILLYLYGDKNTVVNVLWKDFTNEEIQKKIQRQNVANLCDTIIAAVEPKEYVLIIDDISKISPSGKKVIEKLKDAFIIVCGARQVKANDTSFLWNFERIKIESLKRKYAMQLINVNSSSLEIENKELFRNHIWQQTNGNPRAISELIQRYSKEPFLDNQTIRSIRHTGALKEIDMTWLVVLFLGVITATRYMARELDEPALRFIGSIAMIALLMYRPIMRSLKKQFI